MLSFSVATCTLLVIRSLQWLSVSPDVTLLINTRALLAVTPGILVTLISLATSVIVVPVNSTGLSLITILSPTVTVALLTVPVTLP